jgi:hypothetical protein
MTTETIIGRRVRLKGAYLDEAETEPVVGTIEDVIELRPGTSVGARGLAYVVMFDHNEPMLPPGGEFTADRLELIGV